MLALIATVFAISVTRHAGDFGVVFFALSGTSRPTVPPKYGAALLGLGEIALAAMVLQCSPSSWPASTAISV